MKSLWHSWRIRVSGENHEESQNSRSPEDFQIPTCKTSNMRNRDREFDMSEFSKGVEMQHTTKRRSDVGKTRQ
jgi:hypothetical protein